MTGQCRAEFYGGGTRCELGDGHAGNHLRSGFAQWDEPLSHYPAEVAPTGGLLDMLEPGEPVASGPACDCSCHTMPGVMHVAACCSTGLTDHNEQEQPNG